MGTLCTTCKYKRDIISGKGSRFLLCELALSDERFAKYPPQPILRCSGFILARDGQVDNLRADAEE